MNKPNINLFIVGAAKSGTTSLYNYLRQHPEVFLPRVKEPNFYSNIESEDPLVYNPPKKGVFYHNKIINDPGIYYALYEDSEAYRIVGDCSPSYLWDNDSALRIYKDFPDSKIVVILRDPVMRTFSHFLMNIKSGIEKETNFLKALKRDEKQHPKVWGDGKVFLYNELGMYHDQLKTYFDVFSREKVKVIIYEEFFSNIEEGLVDLFEFLELNSNDAIDYNQAHNSYNLPKNSVYKYLLQQKNSLGYLRNLMPQQLKNYLNQNVLYKDGEKPELSEDAKDYLQGVFSEDIKKLEVLLGTDLVHWSK